MEYRARPTLLFVFDALAVHSKVALWRNRAHINLINDGLTLAHRWHIKASAGLLESLLPPFFDAASHKLGDSVSSLAMVRIASWVYVLW